MLQFSAKMWCLFMTLLFSLVTHSFGKGYQEKVAEHLKTSTINREDAGQSNLFTTEPSQYNVSPKAWENITKFDQNAVPKQDSYSTEQDASSNINAYCQNATEDSNTATYEEITEEIAITNPSLLKAEEPNMEKFLFFLYISIVCVYIYLSNGMVIYVVARYRKFHYPGNYTKCAYATLDILLNTSSQVWFMVVLYAQDQMPLWWCQGYSILTITFFFATMYMTAYIALER